MRVKEYEAWLKRHGSSKAGYGKNYDEYNRSFKQERPKQPEEYACRNVEEYHHYSEFVDLTKEDDDEEYENEEFESESEKQQSKKDSKSKNKSRSGSRNIHSLVARVAGVATMSVIVVTGYNTIKENEAKKLAPVIANVTWVWTADNLSATGSLLDESGNLVKTVTVASTSTKEEATCNKEGTITYTVKIDENGKTYTDTKTEAIPQTAHHWNEGSYEVKSDGTIVVTYECLDCHEHFTTTITYTEE